MDPLTAFGIACNVMQAVSFTHEIFTLLRRISQDGSPDASLADKSAQLSDLSQCLKGSLEMHQQTKPLTENQQRLQTVAKKCLNSANSLKDELDKMKWKPGLSGSNSRTQRWFLRQTWTVLGRKSKTGPSENNSRTQRGLLCQTWRVWWGQSKIDKLQKEMNDVEQTMQSTILTDVWLSQGATSIQQEERFNTLDNRLKHFIRQYGQGFRELSDLIVDEATAIKEEVGKLEAQLEAQEIARAKNEECERFLKSLLYETMNARKSQVVESYQNTFDWIFDNTISREWDSFSEWLKSDQQIYWISGKPGSGKSTLMKFLYRDERTKDALDEWATNSAIISYFLWNAGDSLQRSVKGILCSLTYQLLEIDRSLITRLITEQPELLTKRNYNDWSDRELEGILIQGICILTRPLCIFLDGLDEIDRHEGFFYLVNLIERLRSKSSVKLCISSRPEIPLQVAFTKYPKLRLQDLTRKDISRVVDSFLKENFHWWDENVEHDKKRQNIMDEVVRSADGVFLWVHLVLKSLQSGCHIDTYEQMLGRIRELPKTLEGLYKQAWERLGEDQSRYREEAARYFRLVMEARELHYDRQFFPSFSLFNLSTCGDKIQSSFLDDKIIPPVTELLRNAERCRREVESYCMGLLEFHEAEVRPWYVDDHGLDNFYCQFLVPLSAYVSTSNSGGEENTPGGKDLGSLWNIFYRVKVDFIHRTAADFLVESEYGRIIINSDPASASDIRAKIFQSQLIRTLVFFFPWSSFKRNCAYDSLGKKLGRGIPDEMRRRLLILHEDTYERLLDRAPVMEFIIKELRLQIRNGQFDATFYKILCDFASSTIAKYIAHLRPSFYQSDAVKASTGNGVIDAGEKLQKTSKVVPCIHAVCTQILAKYISSTDLPGNVNWPAEMPKIQVPRYAKVSSDDLSDLIFAHLFCTRWILVDASRCFRSRTAQMVTQFLYAILNYQLVELAQRWLNRRPGPYDGVRYFKQILLRYPAKTQEMQELRESISESDMKVANQPDSSEERETHSMGYATLYMGNKDSYRIGEYTMKEAAVSNLDDSVHSDDEIGDFL